MRTRSPRHPGARRPRGTPAKGKNVIRLDGLPCLVAVVQVVASRVVEVDGLLDQPLTQRAGVEVHVGLWVSGDGSHMV